MKTRSGPPGNSRVADAPKAQPSRPLAQAPGAASAARPDPAKNYKTALRSYRFQRAKAPGIIEVLNENSYVMAEYSERTGSVKWQRMVLASQREQIEKWLEDHFPRS